MKSRPLLKRSRWIPEGYIELTGNWDIVLKAIDVMNAKCNEIYVSPEAAKDILNWDNHENSN